MSRDKLLFDSVIITLLVHLLRRYRTMPGTTLTESATVSLDEFFKFVLTEGDLSHDRAELMDTYGITEEEFDAAERVLSDPVMCMTTLLSKWCVVLFADVPSYKPRPKNVMLSAFIDWGDRSVILPISATLHPTMNDGFVLGFWQEMLQEMLQAFISAGGSDGLYPAAPNSSASMGESNGTYAPSLSFQKPLEEDEEELYGFSTLTLPGDCDFDYDADIAPDNS